MLQQPAGQSRVACANSDTSKHEVINVEQRKAVELAWTMVRQENARIQRVLTQANFQQFGAGTTEPFSGRANLTDHVLCPESSIFLTRDLSSRRHPREAARTGS